MSTQKDERPRPEPLPGTDWYEEDDMRFLLKGMSRDTFTRFAEDVGLEAYHATATFRWYSLGEVMAKMQKRPVKATKPANKTRRRTAK